MVLINQLCYNHTMELWKESVNKVYLDVPASWTTTATWKKDGVNQGALTATANLTDDRWESTLPYILNECTVDVVWTFSAPVAGSQIKTDSYDVITPLLTKREILSIAPEATDVEIVDLEAAVRFVIQAFTGQVFGNRTKTLTIRGEGATALALPERLFRLDTYKTLYSNLDPRAAIIIADGWYLKKRWSETTSVDPQPDELYFAGAEDDPGPWTEGTYRTSDGGYAGGMLKSRGSSISWGNKSSTWKDDYPFIIVGGWGYQAIPMPIKEAAKLLVNDYACLEQAYRDRYLKSIKSADWHFQFHNGAYVKTGNVRADQLLDDYVLKRGWAVI